MAPACWLQLAPMAVATANDWKVKGLDWHLVVVNAKGYSYLFISAYFTHSLGPCGVNVIKMKQIRGCHHLSWFAVYPGGGLEHDAGAAQWC